MNDRNLEKFPLGELHERPSENPEESVEARKAAAERFNKADRSVDEKNSVDQALNNDLAATNVESANTISAEAVRRSEGAGLDPSLHATWLDKMLKGEVPLNLFEDTEQLIKKAEQDMKNPES